MEQIEGLFTGYSSYAVEALNIITAVFALLYMHNYAKYRNKKLSAVWYIFGIISPLITVIVFKIKSKRFPTPETRICPQCENEYPEGFTVCNRCLLELPEHDFTKKEKQKKLSKVFAVLFVVVYIISVGCSAVMFVDFAKDIIGSGGLEGFFNYITSETSKIGFTDENGNTIYYDKMGNSYEDPMKVPVYSKDGTAYIYEENLDYEVYYISEDGDKIDPWYCYVDEDGWLYVDEDDSLLFGDNNTDFDDYKYYDFYLTDENENKYYLAEEASWDSEGNLITSDNDPYGNN